MPVTDLSRALQRPGYTIGTEYAISGGTSEIAFWRTLLVWLNTRIPYQPNIFFRLRKNAISDEPSEIGRTVLVSTHFICNQALTLAPAGGDFNPP